MRRARHHTDDRGRRVAEHRGRRRHPYLRGTPASGVSGSLFDDDASSSGGRKGGPTQGTPLAERIRPHTLDEIVGQEEILAPGRPLREAIERDLLQSILLWGPPGTGKTTLARIIAEMTQAHFVPFSAVLAGIKELSLIHISE